MVILHVFLCSGPFVALLIMLLLILSTVAVSPVKEQSRSTAGEFSQKSHRRTEKKCVNPETDPELRGEGL